MITDKREIADFVQEFAERCPDYTDTQVLLAVSEYVGFELTEDMVVSRLVLYVYDSQDVETALRIWG